MTVGTKSVLFGAHCFFLHPFFVAEAWRRLYGFPFDPRLWVAFFVHDLGYLGKPNMDGPEGETHPRLGARIMATLFDGYRWREAGMLRFSSTGQWSHRLEATEAGELLDVTSIGMRFESAALGSWGLLCLLHSRFYSKQLGLPFSRLCVADKLAIALTPAWLYLPMVRASGEIDEYMRLADDRNLVINGVRGGKYSTMRTRTAEGEHAWYADVQDYVRRWAMEHKDGREDRWTPTPEGRP